jgi:hypothetical protein
MEWSCIGAIYPGILECRETKPIVHDRREFSLIEEWFVEFHVEEGMEPCIDINSSKIEWRLV